MLMHLDLVKMQCPTALLSLILILTLQRPFAFAGPYPKDELHDTIGSGYLVDRDCVSLCGQDGQYCCSSGQVCYTNAANIALCGAQTAFAGQAAGWAYYTTTYVMTNLQTVTSTFSSFVGAPTPTSQYLAASTAVCFSPETPCGAICCDSSQYCYALGNCRPIGSTAGATSSFSAPLRPTTASTSTTVAVTTTQAFVAPLSTISGTTIPLTQTSSGGGLSAGAIAGIVIGTIAGIIILILICFCCILRAGIDGVLGLLGLRNNRRRTTERTEVIEERYSRNGGASRRETHTGWFGGGGGRERVRIEEKRTSFWRREGGILAAIAIGLAGLWAILGFRERRRARENVSDVSYTEYSTEYTASSVSSQSAPPRRSSRR